MKKLYSTVHHGVLVVNDFAICLLTVICCFLALQKLIDKLDERANIDKARSKKYVAKSKVRSQGIPSSGDLPLNAARWTIADAWLPDG